jgi:hypothetical protein
MQPISFDTVNQRQCFNQFIEGKALVQRSCMLKRKKLIGVKWKYNSRYWTNGLRSSQTGYQWCHNKGAVDSSFWSYGEPNNANATENCAQLVIHKKNSTVMLEDRHCGVVSAMACKVEF